jgi:hypothetical protein
MQRKMEPHALGNRHFFQMGSSETAQETPAIFLKEIRGSLMDIRALKLSGDCRGEQHLRQAALLDLKRLPLDLLCSSRDSKETEKSKNNILPLSNLSKSLLLCFSILFLGAIIRSGVFSQGATLPSLVVQCYRSQAMDKCCNGFG